MQNESGFTPNPNLVLIKPLKVEVKSAAGIDLPQGVIDKETKAARVGHVVEIGVAAAQTSYMHGIGVGDMVLFMRYAGDFLPSGGVEYIIARPDIVLGKLSKVPDYQINAARGSAEVWPSVAAPTNPKEAAPRIIRPQ